MEHVVGARARHGRTENMPQMLLGHLRQRMHHALLDPPEASVLLFSESPIHVIERVTLQSVLVPLRVGNSQDEPCSGCHMDAWTQGEQSARTKRNPCHCGSVLRLLLCRGQDLAVLPPVTHASIGYSMAMQRMSRPSAGKLKCLKNSSQHDCFTRWPRT